MKKAIVIPARYESTRFPGKPLALINGKPMIQWVVEAALKSKYTDEIIVATEDERIIDFVNGLKIKNLLVEMTSKLHESGTDRIAEIIKRKKDIEYIVNLQGDEPVIPPHYIDKVFEPLLENEEVEMSTLITQIKSKEELEDPNVVKVVMDKNNFALYFSRSKIPFFRDQEISFSFSFRHLGIYGYRRKTILDFSNLQPSSLEKAEKLEQLRALQNGVKIKLEIVESPTQAVDIPNDVLIVEKILSQRA